MGREVRHVPENWQHPKAASGRYVPLLPYSFTDCLAQWKAGLKKWEASKHDVGDSYEEDAGACPVPGDYMPEWVDAEKTHLQMYENTSEGTPISPVMKTPEDLAWWLFDHKASAFGDQTATYAEWLATIKQGWAASAVSFGGRLISGVAANAVFEKGKTK